jgi:hypothetical protein
MNPIWVRYEVDRSETKEWIQSFGGKHPAVAKFSHNSIEYALKGDKSLWKCEYGDESRSPWDKENFMLYNGEIEVSKGNSNQFLITRNRTGHQFPDAPLDVVGENRLRGLLNDWSQGKWKFKEVVQTELTQSGENVLLLDILFPPPGWRDKYWLLTDKDYMVQRSELYNDKRDRFETGVAQEISNVNGIAFPVRGKTEHFLRDGKLGYTAEFRATSVESKASKIPDRLFEFEFPEEASVYDQDLKVFVRNTDLMESHLTEVIRRAGGHRYLWTEWWFLLAVVLVLTTSGFGFVLWRRKRRMDSA